MILKGISKAPDHTTAAEVEQEYIVKSLFLDEFIKFEAAPTRSQDHYRFNVSMQTGVESQSAMTFSLKFSDFTFSYLVRDVSGPFGS